MRAGEGACAPSRQAWGRALATSSLWGAWLSCSGPRSTSISYSTIGAEYCCQIHGDSFCAGKGASAPCLQARGRIRAAGSVVGRLVQLQRVTVLGLLVTAGLACGPGGSGRESGAAPLQEAGALLGASGLQVRVRGRLALGFVHLSGRCCWTFAQSVSWH